MTTDSTRRRRLYWTGTIRILSMEGRVREMRTPTVSPVDPRKPPKITPHTDNPFVRKNLVLPKPETAKKPKEKKEVRKKPKVWAVDFDGTLALGGRGYPEIGKPNEELIASLQMAKLSGVKLILWTSREGKPLDEALAWCEEHGLTFDAVNENIPEMVQLFGYDSRKVGADLYIDDRAFHFWGTGEGGDLSKLVQKL